MERKQYHQRGFVEFKFRQAIPIEEVNQLRTY